MNNSLIIIACLAVAIICFACKPKNSGQMVNGVPAEINTEQLASMIKDKADIVLLDVRTPGEIADGKIEGAIEIDYHSDNFMNEINKLDKNKHYVIYCRSGGRSGKTAKKMLEAGFEKCTNVAGGYSSWKK